MTESFEQKTAEVAESKTASKRSAKKPVENSNSQQSLGKRVASNGKEYDVRIRNRSKRPAGLKGLESDVPFDQLPQKKRQQYMNYIKTRAANSIKQQSEFKNSEGDLKLS